MQRVWTVVLSVWAMLAIVAVLAWSHRPVPVAAGPSVPTYVAKVVNGKTHFVLVQPSSLGATHGTTSTSAVVR
jgi:hypothetical protein